MIPKAELQALRGEWSLSDEVIVVEPYSLRRTNDGHLLLYVVNDHGEPRSYRVDRIASAVATNETFTPRYLVEF